MTTYYVATLANYVLVAADNEADARERGRDALGRLHTEEGHPNMPIKVRTVRPASAEEIDLMAFHDRMVANERTLAAVRKRK